MFETTRARKSFERCAVRALAEGDGNDIGMICPKYPEGFTLRAKAMVTTSSREEAAMTLGCLSCPYRKVPLPHGESAVQAIQRIGSAVAVSELNRLIDGQQTDH